MWLNALLALLTPLVHAAEGMWLPEQLPALADELTAAGVTVDPAALADLDGEIAGAIVSLGGCSASFVSPDGLIVTNHHCAYRTLQHRGTEGDLLRDGFLAEGRGDELAAVPGTFVYVTTDLRDVTAEVVGKIPKRAKDADRARLVQRRQRALVDGCEAQTAGVRCRVAELRGGASSGARFLLVTQLEIPDVRMVYAPPLGIGNFGGEVDNWMWPRHTGDFAFLRAWVGPDGQPAERSADNVPYRPARWLRIADGHRSPGDPVLVVGYPGRTHRWETAAELAADAAFRLPEGVRYAERLIELLEAESADPARAQKNYPRIRRLANGAKKQTGVLDTLRDGAIEAERREREAAISAAVASDRKRAKAGDPVAAIAALVAERRRTEQRDLVLAWLGRSSPMLDEATELWRMAEERERPDLDREEGYRDRDRSRFAQDRERAQSWIDPASDRATLRFALEQAAALPPDQRIDAFERALALSSEAAGGARIEALLDRLYAGTKMGDLAARQALLDASLEDLAATDDAMIALVEQLAPELEAQRERKEAFEGAMLRLRPQYEEALTALASDAPRYPDANGTLRLSFGRIEGYSPAEAVRYEPRTSLAGVLAKATGEAPFDAPEGLLAAARAVPPAFVDPALVVGGTGTVPVNFLSTCDITGGNSGSATLDGAGRLIGLAFDTNLEGVASDHAYDGAVTRSIHVDFAWMRWVMDEVDHAEALLEEMGVEPLRDGAPTAERSAGDP
jgi:hypothetical protein